MREKQTRARYTLEFKLEAVRLVNDGQSIGVTAKVLGVPKATLSNWVRDAAKGTLQGAGDKVLSPALFHRVFSTQFCDAGRATSRIGPPGDAMWDGGVMRVGNEDGPGMPGRVAW